MSRKEDIDNAIWSDPDFEALSLEATALYLWSFTNPRCGMAGLYKVSRRAMTESKVPDDRLDTALTELETARFCFFQDGVLFVRTRARHLRQKTEQIAKSIRSDVAKLPEDHPLRAQFLTEYSADPWLRNFLSTTALATVTRGSDEGLAVPAPRRNGVTLSGRSADRLGKGQRQGQGKGPSREGSGEGFDWAAWGDEHLPDMPRDLVAMTAVRLSGGGHDITPDTVRQQLLSTRPYLAEQDAPTNGLGEAA